MKQIKMETPSVRIVQTSTAVWQTKDKERSQCTLLELPIWKPPFEMIRFRELQLIQSMESRAWNPQCESHWQGDFPINQHQIDHESDRIGAMIH